MRILGLLVLAGLLATQGCAVVAVGAVAAAAGGVTYTVLGTVEKTYNEDYDTVVAALQKALVTLDIKTGDTKRIEEKGQIVTTEIEAYARDLTIRISIERISDKATRVVVDASKKYVVKDAATAGEILNQTTNNLAKKS
jgi:mannitol-1-phosphate/altronate dehydrogenase